jgi:Mg/Co/Ni transporter MgtE
MEGNEKPLYRKGRLVIPPGIRDQDPGQVAAWLGRVPVADRARAFRALPLNLAAAAFLQMDPPDRVSLLAGLNPANIRYLMSIMPDGQLLETLEAAGDDVHAAVMGSLPDWRYHRIEQTLAAHLAELVRPEVAEKPASRRRSWWTRMLERLRAARP